MVDEEEDSAAQLREWLPSWRALADRYSEDRDAELADFTGEYADQVATSHGSDLWHDLSGVQDPLARCAILADSATFARFYSALREAVDRAVVADVPVTPDTAAPAVSLVQILMVGQCAGARDATPADTQLVQRLLAAVGNLRDGLGEVTRRWAAFAALGFGLPQLPVDLLDLSPLPDRVDPGRSVGRSVAEFVWYAAAAERAGLDRAGVEPAWRDFVGGFPLKLEIGAVDWPDLVAAGRAVHTVLGHAPVSQVVELIRADLP